MKKRNSISVLLKNGFLNDLNFKDHINKRGNMQAKIVDVKEKKLIGMKKEMSLIKNETAQLWQGFAPRIKEIKNRIGEGKFSIQVYNTLFDPKSFNPETQFTKWAAVEVESVDEIPNGMEEFTLPGGKYAVFIHKGPAREFFKTAQFIYGQWINEVEYELDDRPHFEFLGEKYLGVDNPDSEEEVWVPIK